MTWSETVKLYIIAWKHTEEDLRAVSFGDAYESCRPYGLRSRPGRDAQLPFSTIPCLSSAVSSDNHDVAYHTRDVCRSSDGIGGWLESRRWMDARMDLSRPQGERYVAVRLALSDENIFC